MRHIFFLFLFMMIINVSVGQAQDDNTTLPDDFPTITIDVSTDPSDGFIYLANLRRQGSENRSISHYLMVLDNQGVPVFHEQAGRSFNFGRIEDGFRYYFQFTDNGLGRGAASDGIYNLIDDAGTIVGGYQVQGDLPTQAHEFLQLDNGNVALLSQPVHIRDLSEYDGHPEALVADFLQRDHLRP